MPSVTSYAWDAKQGALKPVATISTEPAGPPAGRQQHCRDSRASRPGGSSTARTAAATTSPSIGSSAATGQLTLVEHEPTRGKTPRNFTIDPSGRWLIAANQNSDTLAVFSINDKDGTLTPVGPLADVGAPVSVVFVP